MAEPSSNKRIAGNTLVLYLRMLVSIGVNLYTVRLLWHVLGVDNYGIYNVVGGIVFMFAFLNNAMVVSSQRFISFELGKGNFERLQRTFSISVTIHFFLAVIILLLAESVGLWFLNYKMNIPPGRMGAANWVFQCSVLTFIFTIISVPYNACIVAHEHIKIYGYLGIIEVVLKLFIVYIVSWLPFDRLKSYAICILILAALMRISYSLYCSRHFAECRWRYFKDKHLIKEMFNFAGWSFFGSMGYAVRDQGTNIILNLFFNVAVNAAKGVANQVGGVINGFASNFTMALNPQITKRYASGQIDSMISLVFKGCKYSLLLMSMMVVPIVIAAPTILSLWLGDVAPYTIGFMQLILIVSWVDCVVSPITTSIQATGKIKKFQILISCIMLANLPVSWIWLKLGGSAYVVFIVSLLTSVVALITRMMLLRELIDFSIGGFFRYVYLKIIPVIIVVGVLSKIIYDVCPMNFIGLLGFGCVSIGCFCVLSYYIVLSESERLKIVRFITKRLSHR